MPSVQQLRSRLLKKLSELFQLDQPDLDFGFYRIMHAKAQEVQDFIGTDLLKIVADAFGDVDEARKAELQGAYKKAMQTAKDFGAPNPEETEPVKKAKAALDAVKDTTSAEADIYDHLYRFFERYYDDGDFISRRYYTRETSGKAAPFAVPYNGEEVKLHWANADQYYIKSAEYFSNFTFDLRQAKEVQTAKDSLPTTGTELPLKVHFRVIEASEGEHGNVKATDAAKRFFILHADKPVNMTDAGELVVNFEYRPDLEKSGQENTWRDKRNAEATETILARLQALAAAGGEPEKQVAEYMRLLKVPAPTDSDKKRPVLAKYVNQYTGRNTMDYFIHKDLGGFLRRELDFYIKNEIMRLDDIENADAPAVESYLAKIKVLRKISGKLIDFLAQLEDFQKKLWLKKKFIVETNYCITLDRVPEGIYPEVAANEAQCEEWIKLFAIDEIQADLHTPAFSRPLTVEFLKANNKLVLDTRFFNDSFKAWLVASIENFDEACDGLLIHSENFQALNLLQERYREQVKCVYIDPPYNTGGDDFIYKDAYQESSWLSLMHDRLGISRNLLRSEGTFNMSIDIKEIDKGIYLLDSFLGMENRKSNITIKRGSLAGAKVINPGPINISENLLVYSVDIGKWAPERAYREKEYDTRYGTFIKNVSDNCRLWVFSTVLDEFAKKHNTDKGKLRKLLGVAYSAKLQEFVIENSENVVQLAGLDEKAISKNALELKKESKQKSSDVFHLGRGDLNDYYFKNGQVILFYKHRLLKLGEKLVPAEPISDIWDDVLPNDLHNEGGVQLRKGKKPEKFLHRVVEVGSQEQEIVLDFFAGSATCGAVSQKVNRKWINIEHNRYFDDITLRRMKATIYGDKSGITKVVNWKGGGLFKYIRLESYEDTLNNLRLDHNPQRKKAVAANPALKEDYMLRYLLDVETRGSQSLLNIDAFADPTAYTLKVKKPGTDEHATRAVDLIETFNYLIGLRVVHYAAPQEFTAKFKRIEDPEVPKDQQTKLVLDGKLQELRDFASSREEKTWRFRKVEGWVPKDQANPNNGQREKVLIVWRKLTGDIEQDNLMLDEWFQSIRISTRDFEFDTIYVNGSNNLPNLKLDEENWKVRLIEEDFMKRMWDVAGA